MNAKRREDIVGVLPKRTILYGEGVAGKPGHDDIHHHIRPQHSGPGSLRR